MGNEYVVIGWGYQKKDGSPYSKCARIVTDVKEGKYCFVDTNNCIYLDYHEKIGTIKTAEVIIS